MKKALVFGATGGIGQAIVNELAAAGWSLDVHCHRRWPQAKKMAQRLMKQYPQQDFLPVKLDFLTDNASLTAFVKNLLPVNAVVFAEGATDYGLLNKQPLAAIEREIALDLTVPIKLTRLLEPMLTKYSFSRIVYLGSVYGGQGSALETVYSAAKAGLSRFAQAYAREVASTGLTVNVVAPGAVDTPMNDIFSPADKERVKTDIPSGRWAKGSDLSFWVKNLLSERSDYCTGQTIYVSGGWLE